MTYSRTVTAILLEKTTLAVVAGSPLAKSFDHTFMDELSGPGTGSITVPLLEAGAAELTPGRYVRILVEGTARFTFKIEGTPDYKQIMRGNSFEQTVTVSGRGWACMLDEAIVYPDAAPGLRLDTSWRIFSFASKDFPVANQSAWANAVHLYEYLDGVTYGQRYQFTGPSNTSPMPSPISFPWPTQGPGQLVYTAGPPQSWAAGVGYDPTYWIWTQQGTSTEEYGIGYGFFRKTLVLAAPTVVEFAVTADNAFTLFVEGIPVVGENDDIWIWTAWKDATINFPAGTFQIAIVVENVSHGLAGEGVNQNSAGLIMNAYTRGAGQLPETRMLRSDNTWSSEFVPATNGIWPGWTAGQIINKLVDEATLRGSLTAYVGDTSPSFTATLDSASTAWASPDPNKPSGYIPAFAVNVGTTIMAALGQLKEQGWVDWHIQPTSAILDMWSASRDTGNSGVTFVAGVNITSLERGASEPYANALLVQWDQDYVYVPNPTVPGGIDPEADIRTAITAYGSRVEDIWSTDAASQEEARSKGRIEVRKRIAESLPSIAMGIEPTSTTDCPYEGFNLGAQVTIPAVGGGTQLVRVLSITMTTDKEGNAIWALELNKRWDSPRATANDLLRAIGGRGGSSSGGVVY